MKHLNKLQAAEEIHLHIFPWNPVQQEKNMKTLQWDKMPSRCSGFVIEIIKKNQTCHSSGRKRALSISAAFQISQSPIDQRSHQPCKVILRFELQYLAFGMGLHTNGFRVFFFFSVELSSWKARLTSSQSHYAKG